MILSDLSLNTDELGQEFVDRLFLSATRWGFPETTEEWTKRVFRIFTTMAGVFEKNLPNGYSFRVHHEHLDDKAFGSEHICDLTWVISDKLPRNKYGSGLGIYMGLECEWGSMENVLDDFEKLQDVSARGKIVIYDSNGRDYNYKLRQVIKKHFNIGMEDYLLIDVRDRFHEDVSILVWSHAVRNRKIFSKRCGHWRFDRHFGRSYR